MYVSQIQQKMAMMADQVRRMKKIDSFDEDVKSVFDSIQS